MDFTSALQAMRAGKIVRRNARVTEWSLIGESFRYRVPGWDWHHHPICTEDILANDWLIICESFRPSSEDLTAARARIAVDRLEDLARRVEALERSRPTLPSPEDEEAVAWWAKRLSRVVDMTWSEKKAGTGMFDRHIQGYDRMSAAGKDFWRGNARQVLSVLREWIERAGR